jgi:hypothetical protein
MAGKPGTYKRSCEEVLEMCKEKIPGLEMDKDTYKGMGERCRFLHPEYGEWWTTPSKVLLGQGPKKGQSKKVKETLVSRYGVSSAMDVPGAKEKAKETFIEKYGVENPFHKKEIRDKCKATLMERYGVSHPLKDEDIKKRHSKSVQSYFDTDIDSFREKSKRTCMEKYGVENPMHSDDIRQRLKESFLKKYGADHPMKNEDVKTRANLTKIENGSNKVSKGELEVLDFLKSIGVEDVEQAYIGGVQVDMFSHSRRIGIEYNGLYTHSEESGKTLRYHLNKTIKCEEKDVRLIHIWDYQWNDRNEQTKNFIRGAFGISERRFGARECEFRIIGSEIAGPFLEANHIQGKSGTSTYRVGVYKSEELLAVTSFGPHPRDRSVVTLDRFACLSGVHVAGALSKISKMASLHFKKDMVTWAHRTLSNGRAYESSGWTKDEVLAPDYFYAGRDSKGIWKPIPKQTRKKSTVNTPEGMTEREHAKQDGLLRVWDCGKIRFVYKYEEPT